MRKKNDGEKTCVTCGRIITDSNNKTGLCPRCAKTGKTIGLTALITGTGIAIKRFGKPVINAAKTLLKK